MAKLNSLDRSTSQDKVLDALHALLLDNTFLPGARLRQSVIASEMGVSQGVVREALGRLVEEGLVKHIPFRGMFVAKLTQEDVKEIYQIRIALECLAAELALPRLDDKRVLDELSRLDAQIHSAAQNADSQAAASADIAFHQYQIELSGNSRLVKAWNSLMAQSSYLPKQLHSRQPDPYEASHLETIEAFHTRTIDIIRKTIRGRLESSLANIIGNWDS